MTKIVCSLKPFEINQKIYVLEDGIELATATANVSNIADIIMGLAAEYDITQVDFCGPQKFSIGLKEICQTHFASKYKKSITINII